MFQLGDRVIVDLIKSCTITSIIPQTNDNYGMFEVTTDLGEKILIPYSEAESRIEHKIGESEEEEIQEPHNISKIVSIVGMIIIAIFFLYKVFAEEPKTGPQKENPIITLEREKEKELDIQKTCVDINAQSRERVRDIEREQTRQRIKNFTGLTMNGETK